MCVFAGTLDHYFEAGMTCFTAIIFSVNFKVGVVYVQYTLCMYVCMYVYMIEVIDTVLRVVIDLFTSYLVDVYTHTDSVVLSRAYHVCMYV